MGDAKRILLAEDDEEYNMLIELALKSAGFSVTSVATGGKALAMMETERYDLLVTDVMMPEIDGYHLAQTVGERFGEAGPKILIMTSRNITKERGVAIMSGASDTLQKPFPVDALIAKVKQMLGIA